MNQVARFKNSTVPRQQGERARVRVIEGPDTGTTFVILGQAAILGRSEQADVFLADLKASRQHAEILLTTAGWGIRDLGSANGVTISGKLVRSAGLKEGDRFTIGGTTLEFFSSAAQSALVLMPPRPPAIQLEVQPADREGRLKKITSFGGGLLDHAHSLGSGVGGSSSKRRVILWVVIAAGLGLVLMAPEDKPAAKGRKSKGISAQVDRESASLPDSPAMTESERNSERFFKAGFREYTAGNYLRAQIQFETALQINPGHSLSRVYLENSRLSIEKEVKNRLSSGRKAASAGRILQAANHFQAVLRLLQKTPTSQLAVEARAELEKVQRRRGGSG